MLLANQDRGNIFARRIIGLSLRLTKVLSNSTGIYVVIKFYPWFKFYSPLFLDMVMRDNEFETKGNKRSNQG